MGSRRSWMRTARLAALGAALAACGGEDETLFTGTGTSGAGGSSSSGTATTTGGSTSSSGDTGGAGGAGGSGAGAGGAPPRAPAGRGAAPRAPAAPRGGGGGGGGGAPASSSSSSSGTTTSSSSSSGGGGGLVAIVDLRADVNRNGTVDLADPSEDQGEDTFDASHGAVFLANLDDDEGACPTQNQTDAQLAACNDAADGVINGPDDLLDLARLRTVPWPDAPADASATIALGSPGASHVRLFKQSGAAFEVFDPAVDVLSAAELQAGVELAIEGKDIVRDANAWDGYVDVTLDVAGGTGPDAQPVAGGADTVRMRVAPVIFRHHLDPAQRIYVTNINSQSSLAFRTDLAAAVQAAGVPNPVQDLFVGDQWTQDFFETAYTAMPGPNGTKRVIHVNFRSANYTNNGLRTAGRVVFTVLRGKDVAGAVQYDPSHPNSMDTLNSFGNLETIPPHTHAGQSYPLGRVLRGSTASYYPDPSFDLMVQSQGVQPSVYIDTEWLTVSHVDETTSFVKAPTPRGWALVLADATLGVDELEAAVAAGYGSAAMFVGKFWSNNVSAQVSINQVLADPDVMNTTSWAAAEIDGQLQVIQAETGLGDPEVIRIGSLFHPAYGYAVAYEPGMVNGVILADGHYGSPNPWGPTVDGSDLFKKNLVDAFAPLGITVHWIENWNLYHRLLGEVHCGTNTTRAIPANVSWWESGL